MKFDITLLLDRSGSMQDKKDDHIGGVKSFIQDNKSFPDTTFSLIQFDSQEPFELVINNQNIDDVDLDKIDLIPRGGTPLLDAIGKTIAHIDNKKQNNENTQIVLMVVTDGEENDSKEWKKNDLKKLIIEKEKDWKILYLGANIDVFSESGSFGLSARSSANYINTSTGIDKLYRVTSNKLSSMRSAYSSGLEKSVILDSSNANFTAEDYAELNNNENNQ